MRHTHYRRGSSMTLAVVVSVVITGLVATLCWMTGEQAQRTGSLSKIDQAFYAAEAGLQRVHWHVRNGQMGTVVSPLAGSINGYNYAATWARSDCVMNLHSTGMAGPIAYSLSELVTDPYAVPALQSLGPFDNKNIDLVGDVVAGGGYSNAGTGSITGNLIYYGSVTGTGDVSGAVIQGKGTPRTIDFPALMTTLSSAAGKTYTGDQTGTVFDFTTISGTNRVIYVNGNVSMPTFKGSGTLCVTGTITSDGFGSPGQPVNLVAAGSITTDNNVNIYGSIYTGGDWNRGKFHYVEGVVYTVGIVKTNDGQSNLVQGPTPWFDPRVASVGFGGPAPSITITRFSGPLP
jgi:hypothetical protein